MTRRTLSPGKEIITPGNADDALIAHTWFERKIGLVRFLKLCWSRFCIIFGPSVDKDQCQGLRSVIQVVRNQITSE